MSEGEDKARTLDVLYESVKVELLIVVEERWDRGVDPARDRSHFEDGLRFQDDSRWYGIICFTVNDGPRIHSTTCLLILIPLFHSFFAYARCILGKA